MFRFRYLRLALGMNFPARRMRKWLKHTPCASWDCDTCNPEVGSGMILW
jgi:hypothetical protein